MVKDHLLQLREFLVRYPGYSEEARAYIEQEFSDAIFEYAKPEILAQIYAELGMLDDRENIYKQFSDVVLSKYPAEYNILEVGAGHFPMFAKYVDLRQQQLGTGTITAYDPNLVTRLLGKIKLYKERFTYDTPIDKYDLLVGISPCKATETMLMKAIGSKKEFFIALCGCSHFEARHEKISSTYINWEEYIIEMAFSQKSNDFEVQYELINNFPVISSKKRR